jgi:hypothetical protein
MRITKYVDKIFCINLKKRKDKYKFILNESKKYKLNIVFFEAIKNTKNPALGCLESHLQIIKNAKKNKLQRILIIEDDCEFLREPVFDNIPTDYDMLYLGGNLRDVYEDDIINIKDKRWIKMSCLTTHSYIINENIYDKLIELLMKYKKTPIDVIYKEMIHNNKRSYMIRPQMTTQKGGYSDIEKKYIKYKMVTIDECIKIKHLPHTYDNKTQEHSLKYKMCEDHELPYISILTPTKNRKWIFNLAIKCFNNFDYPREKLEWLIMDDGEEDLTDILPNDDRIKYIKFKTKRNITVAEKRNRLTKCTNYEIIMNMDDDDYYPPYSVRIRATMFMMYPEINIIGCGIICIYNKNKKKFYTCNSDKTMAEASMMYRRKFWEERPFDMKIKYGEGVMFLQDRKYEARLIPYTYVLFVINHGGNLTDKLREPDNYKKIEYINDYELPDFALEIIN